MTDKPLTFAFDLDGTLCQTDGNDYENSVPIKERIACLNKLYNAGHTIVIFTGRGTNSRKDWKKLTRQQIRTWGIKCHRIILGKPHFDLFIDDKAVNSEDFAWT